MDNLERAKNELFMARMQEKHDEPSKYVPLITIVGTLLTSVIIISWMLYLF